jgi:hypothetical protein
MFESQVNQSLSDVVGPPPQGRGRGRPQIVPERGHTMRYQCFCENIYLSYNSIYGHVKYKHPIFYKHNKHFGTNNVIDTYDPQLRCTIRKLLQEPLQYSSDRRRQLRHPLIPGEAEQLRRLAASPLKMSKLEAGRHYEMDQTQKLIQELQQAQEQQELRQRKLKISSQKLEGLQLLTANLQAVAQRYENILGILNIEPVQAALRPQVHSEDQ